MIDRRIYEELKAYIDSRYVPENDMLMECCAPLHGSFEAPGATKPSMGRRQVFASRMKEAASESVPEALAVEIEKRDESFAEALFREIDSRGMSDVQCYKKAHLDRKLFSKLRSDPWYRPSKITAIAFALALEMNEEETAQLLRKAGYALSRSSVFDIVIEYHIRKRIYDFFRINDALLEFDQTLLPL